MKNRYLELLELTPGASDADIKQAYRKLSKRYHPDVNKSDDEDEKFIEITEAYKFLTTVGPKPHNEPVRYDYDAGESEYEKWRRQARQYAYRKAKEARRRQNEVIKKLLFSFDYFAYSILLFNFLIAIDYYLPYERHQEEILTVSKISQRIPGQNTVHMYDELKMKNHTMIFKKGEIPYPLVGELYVITTPIFNTAIKAETVINGYSMEHEQLRSIYRILKYYIPIIFIVALFYKYIIKGLDQQLTMAIVMTFMALIQITMFFRIV